jgi:hypothetical protein
VQDNNRTEGRPRISVRELLHDIFALAGEQAAYLALVGSLIAGGYIALDMLSDGASGIATLVVTLFVQVLVTERLLRDRIAGGRGHRRYGSVFLASILAGLAVIVGLILLIVPGLILIAGWTASTPFIVVEGLGGAAALGASWRATSGSRLAIGIVATVALFAMIAAAAGAIGALYGIEGDRALADEPLVAEIVITNVIASAFTVASWLFAASVYRLLVPDGGHYDEVFA